jgi:ubiquitin-protein ligase E3 C
MQLLLAHLPVSYLTDPASVENNLDQGKKKKHYDHSIDVIYSQMYYTYSSDEENEDTSDDVYKDRDIVMKEASAKPFILPLIRARLDALYDSRHINRLCRFLQLATSSANNTSETIQSISSFSNTLMLRWPMKKDSILCTLLYKSSQRLLQILWQSWFESNEAMLFNDDAHIIPNLTRAVKCITASTASRSWPILFLLCEVYARILLTIDDDEFLNEKHSHMNLLEVQQVIHLSRQLKNILFAMFWRANRMDLTQQIGLAGIQLNQLRSSVTHLLQQIHTRDSCLSFCPQGHWLIPNLDTDSFSSEAVAEEFNLESEQQEEKNASLRPLRMLSQSRLAVVS